MYKKYFKRFFDIVISLLCLPFIGLIIILLSPIIYFSDPGPVFYNAPRKGRLCKQFYMFKFRSMYLNSPDLRNADGSTFNSDKDPRVTRFGHIMRKYSIDELPQLLNVLKGDMSFVGPRPNLNSYDLDYDELPEVLKKRYSIRPGITGYSQAYYRNSISQDEKYKLDAWYADNITFLLDLKILFQTFLSVIKHQNINASNS